MRFLLPPAITVLLFGILLAAIPLHALLAHASTDPHASFWIFHAILLALLYGVLGVILVDLVRAVRHARSWDAEIKWLSDSLATIRRDLAAPGG